MIARCLPFVLLAACASAPRPVVAPAPSPPAPAAPEVAYAEEPQLRSDAARQCMVTAQDHVSHERYAEAVAHLRQCVRDHADDTALRLRYALALTEESRPDDAVSALREGLSHTPDDADLLTFAGGVRLRQAVEGPLVEHLHGQVTSRPSSDEAAEARQARAWSEQARDLFTEALRARPTHLGALEGAALSAQRLGAHEESLRHWERVLALSPSPDAQEHRAEAVAAAGDRDRAIALYETLVREQPARATAWTALAALYDAAHRDDDARRARDRGAFFAWTEPFAVDPTDEHLAAVRALSAWFDEDRAAHQAERETSAREVLSRLGAQRTEDARALLADFAWHHSHDALEELAYEGLRAQGPDAADLLFEQLMGRARSACTIRSSADALARVRDPRLFPILARVLPRDVEFFPIDAATAMETLGDARAVPLLVQEARRPTPPASAGDPLRGAGFRAARARAVLALGAFDTPEVREALTALVTEDEVSLEARAALYRLTHEAAHLQAIERAPEALRARADHLLTGYVERAHTPEATAAAARARAAIRAREAPPAQRPTAPTPARTTARPPARPAARPTR